MVDLRHGDSMTAPSNANTSGLAPCPFCGGEAWLNGYEAKYSDLPPMSRAPQCRSCGASLGYLTTPAKATEAWNRRVTAASAQARIAELDKEVERWISAYNAAHDQATENGGRANAARDRATAAEARAERLSRFGQHTNWELSHGYPDGEEEDGCWLVHSVNGGRNDREWTLIGRGETPDDAIRAALQQET